MKEVETITQEFRERIVPDPDVLFSLGKLVELLEQRPYGRQEMQHTMEVCGFAVDLIQREGLDDPKQIKAIMLAAILHDVGRYLEDDSLPRHTEIQEFHLQEFFSVDDPETRDLIMRCIQRHSISSKEKPSSLEEKVMFDADNLTLFTEFGYKRWFFKAEDWGHVANVQDADSYLRQLFDQASRGELLHLDSSQEILKNSFYANVIT